MSKCETGDQPLRPLRNEELDIVNGTAVSPGYGPLGTRINISPFSVNALLDPMWELVGRTGHLPTPGEM
jgi:hypothetical protein